MPRVLRDKRIALGVGGGIAAYKVVELARELTVAGALVDVLLTRAALEFVTPLTFQTLTKRPIHTAVFEGWTDSTKGHISIGEEADVIVVAPATAHTIAKLANGLADDMLTVSALASSAPLIVAPAMDHHMYLHPATQENLRTLERRGARIVGPDQGPLASGLIGYGRLVSTARLLGAVRAVLGAEGPLAGKKVVVSAGPTREPIDPIRFVSNRSSGKMGYAIAEAALDAGAAVTLITGPVALEAPAEATVICVETAAEMAEAVGTSVTDAHVLIMAAAVADYRPATVAARKIKKTDADLAITFSRTRDILAMTHRPGLTKVGFSAETADLLEHARGKLRSKGLDMIVANEATATMGADEGRAFVLRPNVAPEDLGKLPKPALAEAIIDRVVALLAEPRPSLVGD